MALRFAAGLAGGLVGDAHGGDHLPLRVHLAADQPRPGAALFRDLNPLGEEVSDLYLAKMGAMVRGDGQGPVHHRAVPGRRRRRLDLHRRLARRLLHLRHLPDRAVGHPAGRRDRHHPVRDRHGVVRQRHWAASSSSSLHLIVVTNIDNCAAPVPGPREARLDSALMLLAVFAGHHDVRRSGASCIGPVLMIVIVTTISVYLAVYKGVPLDVRSTRTSRPKPKRLRVPLAAPRKRAAAAKEPDRRSPRRRTAQLSRAVRNSTTRLRAS